MFRKNSVLFLILFIVGLYLVTNKAVIPFVTKVVESDLFFEKSDEDEELGSIKNDRTDFAFTHCKSAFKEDYELTDKAELSPDQYEAWALGNKTYLVRSTVRVPEGDQGMVEKKFACKIQFTGNDGADPSSWKIAGIDFNE